MVLVVFVDFVRGIPYSVIVAVSADVVVPVVARPGVPKRGAAAPDGHLHEVPPELVADLMETGICLAGGGSQLLMLTERLSQDLHMRVWGAEDPMSCVVRGAGIVLEDLDSNARFLVGLERSGV